MEVWYNERKRAGTGEACSSRTAKLLSELCSRYNEHERKTSDAEGGICFSRAISERAACVAGGKARQRGLVSEREHKRSGTGGGKMEQEQQIFKLHSEYQPTGDQPQAIEYLSKGVKEGKKFQTLLGVTGSRKNLYNGKYNRKNTETNSCFSTQ